MTELLQQLLQWISLNPVWAGIAIFLVAMIESLAIIGVLVPGVVLMFGFGAMITTGTLSFWPTFGWAVAGAIVGDSLSFFLGHHYRDQLTSFWPFNKHPRSLEQGIVFFQRYGGKSVFIGRFFGPIRAVIPLVAGMMGMPPKHFIVANVASALIWAPAYLLPGMVLGASLELASEVAFRLVILLLLLVALLWLMIWGIKRLFLFSQPHASIWVQTALNWGRHTRIETHWKNLAIGTTVLVLLMFGIQTGRNHTADMVLYTPVKTSIEEWRDSSWRNLPQRAQHNHPLHLQYAGTLYGLQKALVEKGWQPAPKLNWSDTLKLLSPSLPLNELPVLPQVHNGQHERLTLIKPLPNDGRLVLRLWRSNIILSPGQKPLWLGNVSRQQQAYILDLITFAETAPDFQYPFEILLQDTANMPRKQQDTVLLLQDVNDSESGKQAF